MKTARAFTLVELLVVIAIISILAALLMPALSKSKNQGAKVTDINNLRQIMIAVRIYSDDNTDVLPWPNWAMGDVDTNGISVPGWLYTYNQKVASSPDRYQAQTGVLWKMLGTSKIYLCPQDDPQMTHWSNKLQKDVQRLQQSSSYVINGAVCGYTKMLYPSVKLGQLQPGDCIF